MKVRKALAQLVPIQNDKMKYTHTQHGPLGHLLMVIALVTGVSAWFSRHEPAVAVTLGCVAAFLLLLAAMFQHLTIADAGEAIDIRFGPVSAFRRRIRYDEITSAEIDRTSWIDGWGIHWIPGRGTTWNLCGFDCVRLTINGKTVRLGSDDATQLAAFIRSRIVSQACHG